MSDRATAGPTRAPAGPAVPPDSARGRSARPSWMRPEIWVTVLLVVLDQVTKLLVLQRIPLHDTVPVIPGLLNLTYVRNTGAAFGMLNASDFAYKPLVVAGLAILALIGILWYARTFAGDAWPARYGFVLIVAGAVGNLIDRVTLGYVVDFVDVYAGSWHFWAFNVADAAITIGAILFAADTLFSRRHVPEAA
jgi:signal peptidase II